MSTDPTTNGAGPNGLPNGKANHHHDDTVGPFLKATNPLLSAHPNNGGGGGNGLNTHRLSSFLLGSRMTTLTPDPSANHHQVPASDTATPREVNRNTEVPLGNGTQSKFTSNGTATAPSSTVATTTHTYPSIAQPAPPESEGSEASPQTRSNSPSSSSDDDGSSSSSSNSSFDFDPGDLHRSPQELVDYFKQAAPLSQLQQSKIRHYEARGACVVRVLWIALAVIMLSGMVGVVMITKNHSWAPAVASAYGAHPRRMLMVAAKGVEAIRDVFAAAFPQISSASPSTPATTAYYADITTTTSNQSAECAEAQAATKTALLAHLDAATVSESRNSQRELVQRRLVNFAMRFVSEMSPSVRTYLRPLGGGDTVLNGLHDVVRVPFEADVDAPLVEFVAAQFPDTSDVPSSTSTSSSSSVASTKRGFKAASLPPGRRVPLSARAPFTAADVGSASSTAASTARKVSHIPSYPMAVSPVAFRSLCSQNLRLKVNVASATTNFRNDLVNPVSGYLMDQLVLSGGSCRFDSDVLMSLLAPDTLPNAVLNHALAFNRNVSDTLSNRSSAINSTNARASSLEKQLLIDGRYNTFVHKYLWSLARPGVITELASMPSASKNGVEDVDVSDDTMSGYRGTHVRFASTVVNNTNVGVAAIVDGTSLMQQAGGSATYATMLMAGSSATSTRNPLDLIWVPSFYSETQAATEDLSSAPVWLLANNDLLQGGYSEERGRCAADVAAYLTASYVGSARQVLAKIQGLIPTFTQSANISVSFASQTLFKDPHTNFGSAYGKTISAASVDVSRMYHHFFDVRKNWQYNVATWVALTALIALLLSVWATEAYLAAARWLLNKAHRQSSEQLFTHMSRKARAAIEMKRREADLAAEASGIPVHIRQGMYFDEENDDMEGAEAIHDTRLQRDVLGRLLQLGTNNATDLAPSSSDDEAYEARAGGLMYADGSSEDYTMRPGGRERYGITGVVAGMWRRMLPEITSRAVSNENATSDDAQRKLQRHLVGVRERSSLRRETGLRRLQKSLADGARDLSHADPNSAPIPNIFGQGAADGGEEASSHIDEDLLSIESDDRSVKSAEFSDGVIEGRRAIRRRFQRGTIVAATVYVVVVGLVLLLSVGICTYIALYHQQVSLGHITEMFVRREADAIASALCGTSLAPGPSELAVQTSSMAALGAQLAELSPAANHQTPLTGSIPSHLKDKSFSAIVRAWFLHGISGGRFSSFPTELSSLPALLVKEGASTTAFTLAGHTVSIINSPEDVIALPTRCEKYASHHLSDVNQASTDNDAHAAVSFAGLSYLFADTTQRSGDSSSSSGPMSTLGVPGEVDSSGYRTISGISQLDLLPQSSSKVALLRDAALISGGGGPSWYRELGVTAYAAILLPEHIFSDQSEPVSSSSLSASINQTASAARRKKALVVVARAALVLDGPGIAGVIVGVFFAYISVVFVAMYVAQLHRYAPFCGGSVLGRCVAATGVAYATLLGKSSSSSGSDGVLSSLTGVFTHTASTLMKTHNVRFVFYVVVGSVLFTCCICLGYLMESKLSYHRHEAARRSASVFANSVAASMGYNATPAIGRSVDGVLPSLLSVGPLYDAYVHSSRVVGPHNVTPLTGADRAAALSAVQRRIAWLLAPGAIASAINGATDMVKQVSSLKHTVPSSVEFLVFERPTPTASPPSLSRILTQSMTTEEGAVGRVASVPTELTAVGRQQAAAAALGLQFVSQGTTDDAFASVGWTRGKTRKWRLVPSVDSSPSLGVKAIDDVILSYFMSRANRLQKASAAICGNSTNVTAVASDVSHSARIADTALFELYPSIYDEVPYSWLAVAEPMDNDADSGVLETRVVNTWSTLNTRRLGTPDISAAAQRSLPKVIRDAIGAVSDDATLYLYDSSPEDAGLLTTLTDSTSTSSASSAYLVGLSSTTTSTSGSSSSAAAATTGSTASTFTQLLTSKATSLGKLEGDLRFLPLPTSWEPYLRGAAWVVSRLAVSVPHVPAYFSPGFSLVTNSTSTSFYSEGVVATAPIAWEPISLSVGTATGSTSSSNLGSAIHYEVGTRGVVVQRFVGMIGAFDDHSAGGNTVVSNADGISEALPATNTYLLMLCVVSGCFALAVTVMEFAWRGLHDREALLSKGNPSSYLGMRTAEGVFRGRERPSSRLGEATLHHLDEANPPLLPSPSLVVPLGLKGRQQQLEKDASGEGMDGDYDDENAALLFPPSLSGDSSECSRPRATESAEAGVDDTIRTRRQGGRPSSVCLRILLVVAATLMCAALPLSALLGEWQVRSGALSQASFEIAWVTDTVRHVVESVASNHLSLMCDAVLQSSRTIEEAKRQLSSRPYPWDFIEASAASPAINVTSLIADMFPLSGDLEAASLGMSSLLGEARQASASERMMFDALVGILSTLHRRLDASLSYPTTWTLLIANTSDETQFPTADTWAAVDVGRSLLMERASDLNASAQRTVVAPLTLSGVLSDDFDPSTGRGKYGSRVRVPGLSWSEIHQRPSSASLSAASLVPGGNRFPLGKGSSFTLPATSSEFQFIRQREESAIPGLVALPELSSRYANQILSDSLRGGCRGCVFGGVRLHAGGLLSSVDDAGVGGIISEAGGIKSNASAALQHQWCPQLSILDGQASTARRHKGRVAFGLLVGARLTSPSATNSRASVSSSVATGGRNAAEPTPATPDVQSGLVAGNIGAIVAATWVSVSLFVLLCLFYTIDSMRSHPDHTGGNGLAASALAAESRRLKGAQYAEALTGMDEISVAATAKSVLVRAAVEGATSAQVNFNAGGSPTVARKLDSTPYAGVVVADQTSEMDTSRALLQQSEAAAAPLTIPVSTYIIVQTRLSRALANLLPAFVLPTDWAYQYGAQLFEVGEPHAAINRFDVAPLHVPDAATFFSVASQAAVAEQDALDDAVERGLQGRFSRAARRLRWIRANKCAKSGTGKVPSARTSDLARDRGIARIIADAAVRHFTSDAFHPTVLGLASRRCHVLTIVTVPLLVTLACVVVHIILAGSLVHQRDLAMSHQNHLGGISAQTLVEDASSFERNPLMLYNVIVRGLHASTEALLTGSTAPLTLWQGGAPSRGLSSIVFAPTTRRSVDDTSVANSAASIMGSIGSSSFSSASPEVLLLATLPKATRPFVTSYRFQSTTRKSKYAEITANISTLTQLAIAGATQTTTVASSASTTTTTTSTSASALAAAIAESTGVKSEALLCTDAEVAAASVYGSTGRLSSGEMQQSLWSFQSIALLPPFSDSDSTATSSSSNYNAMSTKASAGEILPLLPDTAATHKSALGTFPNLAATSGLPTSPFAAVLSDPPSGSITRQVKDICASMNDCFHSLLRDFALEHHDSTDGVLYSVIHKIKASYTMYLSMVPTLRNEVPEVFSTPRNTTLSSIVINNTAEGVTVVLDEALSSAAFNVSAHVLFLRRLAQIRDLMRRAQIIDSMYLEAGLYPSLVQAPFAVPGRAAAAAQRSFPNTVRIAPYERRMALNAAANVPRFSVNYTFDSKDALGSDVFSSFYVPAVRDILLEMNATNPDSLKPSLSSTGRTYRLTHILLNAPTVGKDNTNNLTAQLEEILHVRRNQTLFRTLPAASLGVARAYWGLLANLTALNGSTSPSPADISSLSAAALMDDTSLFGQVFAPVLASAARRIVKRIQAIIETELLAVDAVSGKAFIEAFVMKYQPTNTTSTSLSQTQSAISALVASTKAALLTIPAKAAGSVLLAAHQESIVPQSGVAFTAERLIASGDPSSTAWRTPLAFLDVSTSSAFVRSAMFAPLHENDVAFISTRRPLNFKHHMLTNPNALPVDNSGSFRSARLSQCLLAKFLSVYSDSATAISSVNADLADPLVTPTSHQLWILQKRRIIDLASRCVDSTKQLVRDPVSSGNWLLNPLGTITANSDASSSGTNVNGNKGVSPDDNQASLNIVSSGTAALSDSWSDVVATTVTQLSPFLLTTQFLRLGPAYGEALRQLWLLEEAAVMRLSNIGLMIGTQHNLQPELPVGSDAKDFENVLYAEAWQRPRRFPEQGGATLPSSFAALPLATMRYFGVTTVERGRLLEAVHELSRIATACTCAVLVVVVLTAIAVHYNYMRLVSSVSRDHAAAAFFAAEDPIVYPTSSLSYSTNTATKLQRAQVRQERKMLLRHPLLSNHNAVQRNDDGKGDSPPSTQVPQQHWQDVRAGIREGQSFFDGQQGAGYVGPNAALAVRVQDAAAFHPLHEFEAAPASFVLLYLGLLANRSAYWLRGGQERTIGTTSGKPRAAQNGDTGTGAAAAYPLSPELDAHQRDRRRRQLVVDEGQSALTEPRFMAVGVATTSLPRGDDPQPGSERPASRIPSRGVRQHEDDLTDAAPAVIAAANEFARSLQLPPVGHISLEQRHQCRYQGLQILQDAQCRNLRSTHLRNTIFALLVCLACCLTTFGLSHWAIFNKSASIEEGYLELDSVVEDSLQLITRIRDSMGQLRQAHLRDLLLNLGEIKSLHELRLFRVLTINDNNVDQVVRSMIASAVGEEWVGAANSTTYDRLADTFKDDVYISYLASTGSVHPSACGIGRKRALPALRVSALQATGSTPLTSTSEYGGWYVNCPVTTGPTHADRRLNRRVASVIRALLREQDRLPNGTDPVDKLTETSRISDGQPASSGTHLNSIRSDVAKAISLVGPALEAARHYELLMRRNAGESVIDVPSALLAPKYSKQLPVLTLLNRKWIAVQKFVATISGQMAEERAVAMQAVKYEISQRVALFRNYGGSAWAEGEVEFESVLDQLKGLFNASHTPSTRPSNVRQLDDQLSNGFGANHADRQQIRVQNYALGSIAKLFVDSFNRGTHLRDFLAAAESQSQQNVAYLQSTVTTSTSGNLSDVMFFDPEALKSPRDTFATLAAYLCTSDAYLDNLINQVLPLTAPLHRDALTRSALVNSRTAPNVENPLTAFLNATLVAGSQNVLMFSDDDGVVQTTTTSTTAVSSASATTSHSSTATSSTEAPSSASSNNVSSDVWYAKAADINAQVLRLMVLDRHVEALLYPADAEVLPWSMLTTVTQTTTWNPQEHAAFTTVVSNSISTGYLSRMLLTNISAVNVNSVADIDAYATLLVWYDNTNASSRRTTAQYNSTKAQALQLATRLRSLLFQRYSPIGVDCLGDFTSTTATHAAALDAAVTWFASHGGECPARRGGAPRNALLPLAAPGTPNVNTTEINSTLYTQLSELFFVDPLALLNLSTDVGRAYLSVEGVAAYTPVGSSSLGKGRRMRSSLNLRELYLRNREQRDSASSIQLWSDISSTPTGVALSPTTTTSLNTAPTSGSSASTVTTSVNASTSPATTTLPTTNADNDSDFFEDGPAVTGEFVSTASIRRTYGEASYAWAGMGTEIERIKVVMLMFLDRPYYESPLLRGLLDPSGGALADEYDRFVTPVDKQRASNNLARSGWVSGVGASESPYATDMLDRHSLVMRHLELQLRNAALGGAPVEACPALAFAPTDVRKATTAWIGRSVIQGTSITATELAALPPLFDLTASPTLEDVVPLEDLLIMWPDAYAYLMQRIVQSGADALGLLQQEGVASSSVVIDGVGVSAEEREARRRSLRMQVLRQVKHDSALRRMVDKLQILAVVMPMVKDQQLSGRATARALRASRFAESSSEDDPLSADESNAVQRAVAGSLLSALSSASGGGVASSSLESARSDPSFDSWIRSLATGSRDYLLQVIYGPAGPLEDFEDPRYSARVVQWIGIGALWAISLVAVALAWKGKLLR